MKQLSEQQIQDNWNRLRDIIGKTFSGERLDKLNTMYDYFEDRMVVAPASGREHYHNAFPGGYVMHIINVTESCLKIAKVWEEMGATQTGQKRTLCFAQCITI